MMGGKLNSPDGSKHIKNLKRSVRRATAG